MINLLYKIEGVKMNKIGDKGQALVEYVLIIALVTVIAVSLIKVFGGYLKDAITKMGCEVSGKEYVETKKIGEGYCEGDEDRVLGDITK